VSCEGRALLIDGEPGHARAVAQILGEAVREVVVAPTLQAAPPGDVDLVVACYDALGPGGAAELLRRYQPLRSRGRVLLFVGAVDRQALATLFGEHGLSNLLANSGDLDQQDLRVTTAKMLQGDVFGIDRYFPPGTSRRVLAVHSSAQRDEILQAARDFALSAGAQARFADLLCNACDELVTNALYNAPVDDRGAPRFAHLSRTQAVELTLPERVDVTLAADDKEMGIAVVDPFGSLKVPTITQYLGKCLRRGSDLVDEKEGGAGLGLFYVFEAVSHFVVNLQAGVRTEMIGLLDLRGRYKDFVQRPKSFNVFVAPSP
jgi:hypothetical protein